MSLLDHQYINQLSGRLTGFVEKTGGVYNSKCPYCECGQGKKKSSKKRFYMIPGKTEGYLVKCHHCGYTTSFAKFLEDYAPDLYSSFKMAKFREGTTGMIEVVEKPKPKVIVKPKPLTPGEQLLKPIQTLTPFHPCLKYVRDRKIPQSRWKDLYYTHDYGSLVNQLTGEDIEIHDERLVISFKDANGTCFAIQGRSLEDGEGVIRYITTKIDKDMPKLWGLNSVHFDRNIWVFEGPIKSMYIPNSVAMAGGVMSTELIGKYLPKNRLVFCFDNEPKSIELISFMEKKISEGSRVVIYNNCRWNGKDPGDWISKEDADLEDVLTYLTRHTFSGIQAKLELAKWRKI